MNKKIFMKIILIIFFLVIIDFTQHVFAHAPSNIDLEYDFDNQKLTSIITHYTPDRNSHYIYRVKIYKNEIIVGDNEYTSQPTDDTYQLSFNISAEKVDVLKVWVECNKGGNIEKSITINGENISATNADGSSTPGFEISLLITIIIFLFIINYKKRRRE